MKRKWLVIAVLIIVLFAAGVLYYVYQKPRPGIETAEAAYYLQAESIYQDFVVNEAEGNRKYTGKVVEVKGKVSEVLQMDSAAIILLAAGNETGGINCSFKNNIMQLPVKGQVVTVKGRCTGFLMDVNLVDAVLVR